MAKKNQAKALPGDTGAVTDDQHGILVKWVNEADDGTVESRKLSEKARDYYDSKQWTAAEEKKLALQKQAATVRNRIKPKMDGLMGMERSNRTTAKALARTPKHAAAAQAATESVRFVLQDNTYNNSRSSAWENLLIEGTCGIEAIVKKVKGKIKIALNHINWDRLIYDPHRRHKDFGDAKYLGQYIWMDHADAVAKYPAAKDILEYTISNSSTFDDKPNWVDSIRKRVRVIELYWKDGGEVKYAVFTRGGYCVEPKVSPYKNEEGETVWPYEFAYMFLDREGNAYGACKQLLDIQDEVNKRGSKALHLMSVRQTFGTKGAVEDVNKTRAELAKPDGHIEFTHGEMGKDFGILPTGDMAAGQFQLLAEAKAEIDAVSYNAAAAGKETRIMSGVALRNREAASQTELAPMFDVLKSLDIRVYRKVWNLIKQYWDEEKWIRVTDDENNLKWVGLNKPMTKGEQAIKLAEEQGVPPDQMQQMHQMLAQDPMSKQIVSTDNDIAEMDMDIIMSDAPDTLTTQIEDFQVLGEMVKSGFQMPPIAVIEVSPLSNKEKIIKMMKEAPQLSPEHQKEMDGMKQQMEQLQQEGQKLQQENQQLKMGQQEAIIKINVEAQATTQKIDAEKAAAAQKLDIQANDQYEKQRLAREQFEFDKSMEIDRYNHSVDLEERKASAEHKRKEDEMASAQNFQDKKLTSDNEFQTKKMDTEHQSKMASDPNYAEMTNQPQTIEVLTQMAQAFQNMESIMQKQLDLAAQTLAAFERPRSVSIGSIQKDAAGNVTGATTKSVMH